jgi:hypothetical protein
MPVGEIAAMAGRYVGVPLLSNDELEELAVRWAEGEGIDRLDWAEYPFLLEGEDAAGRTVLVAAVPNTVAAIMRTIIGVRLSDRAAEVAHEGGRVVVAVFSGYWGDSVRVDVRELGSELPQPLRELPSGDGREAGLRVAPPRPELAGCNGTGVGP